MTTDKNHRVDVDALYKITSYFDGSSPWLTDVPCHANVPVYCSVCGQRLKDGVSYTALVVHNYTEDDIMTRAINWCYDCDKIVRDPIKTADVMKSEFRSALDQFIGRVKPRGGRDG